MPILLEDEVEERTEELVLPKLLIAPPRLKTKLSSGETIAGNRYDVVLACQPDALDHYDLYDNIVDLVEDRKKLRIYSPHNDFRRRGKLKDVIRFMLTEAIPRTRAVLVHLTTVTPEIQKMFEATYRNNKLFLLFYAEETEPFNQATARNIRNHPCYRGEFTYFNDTNAISLLDDRVDSALGIE
ncbi:hypothetical protein HYV88_01255 [Candidatus Woesearchaeota archaeon]|nr:hypothetical protein [Candidatus Woesearchaeota archaeon]